jgi:hypothetical protein
MVVRGDAGVRIDEILPCWLRILGRRRREELDFDGKGGAYGYEAEE